MILNYRAKRNGRGEYHNDFEVISRRGGGGMGIISSIVSIGRSLYRVMMRPLRRFMARI